MTRIPLPPTLAADLRQIEQILVERTHSRAAVISIAGTPLLAADAARTHATLVLLAAQVGHYQRERVQHAAAAVELIHAATQTHDALVDQVERRRGQQRDGTWDHPIALMVGDYLFALAAGEMALAPDARVISFYAHAVMRITEATLEPLPGLALPAQAQERYLARLRATHGALYAAACRAGGACAGVDAATLDLLGRFGEAVGVLLALADELDEYGTTDAARLRAGRLNLPLICAAAQSDGPRLAAALDNPDPAEHEWLATHVRRHGLEAARALVTQLAHQAQTLVAQLPASPAQHDLAAVIDLALRRT